VIQLEEELMQENLPLWVKNNAFKSMDKQNKQLKYSAIYFFQQTLIIDFNPQVGCCFF